MFKGNANEIDLIQGQRGREIKRRVETDRVRKSETELRDRVNPSEMKTDRGNQGDGERGR